MSKVYLNTKEVRRIAGDPDYSTIFRWFKAGTFPSPVKIGPNRNGFLKSEVDEWAEDPQAYREKHGTVITATKNEK